MIEIAPECIATGHVEKLIKHQCHTARAGIVIRVVDANDFARSIDSLVASWKRDFYRDALAVGKRVVKFESSPTFADVVQVASKDRPALRFSVGAALSRAV